LSLCIPIGSTTCDLGGLLCSEVSWRVIGDGGCCWHGSGIDISDGSGSNDLALHALECTIIPATTQKPQ
jgi:hypothetical protein